MTTRQILVSMGGGAFLMACVLFWSGVAKADPYCGPGNNYDPSHSICQPGNPVPYPGLQPYPLPGQYGPGGSGPLPYGGN
jgi:hypothetical protein